MKIWIDLANTSHPLFFKSLMGELRQTHQIYVTARERSETVALARQFDMMPQVIGRDFDNRAIKSLNHALRTIELFLRVPKFDVALAAGGSASVAVSKARRKPSIIFNDNDLIFSQRTFAGSLETKVMARADYIVVPAAFPVQALLKEGAREKSVYQYNGYKEDVYIADYKPDQGFPKKLPFKAFVVLRPEALFASYVNEPKSIVPALLKALGERGINVVYLPRINNDLRYLQGIKEDNIFVPQQALNGLDLCWYADAVLTGSGTFAREAACLGTTAISFFPEQLLSVDQQLVNEGKMFHSRNADEIVDYVVSQPKRDKKLNLERSERVKQQVVSTIDEILGELAN